MVPEGLERSERENKDPKYAKFNTTDACVELLENSFPLFSITF